MVAAGLAPAVAHAAESGAPRRLGWELPPLPYAADALEPFIDARTMEIHHDRHHQAYLTNAQKLLGDFPDLRDRGPEALLRGLDTLPDKVKAGVRNQVGGHVNHAFFWPLLKANGGAGPAGPLAEALARDFGSVDKFKDKFADAAMKRFGSGWAWLCLRPGVRLEVTSTPNQDSPLSEGLVPVLGLDVWEHAYYLKYQNRRADYVAAFWNVVNWDQAAANLAAAG